MTSQTTIRGDEARFTAGKLILYRRWLLPQADPWAYLYLLHGYGDHSGRYLHLLNWLAERGVACHALDFRGHGRSQGRRGFVVRWEEYLDDLEAFLALEAVSPPRGWSTAPVFFLGQSHGALVLTAASMQGLLPSIAGCVLLSPYLRGKMTVPGGKLRLAHLADKILPWLPVPAGISHEWMTTDPQMIQESKSDRLALGSVTPRWFLRMRAVQTEVLQAAGKMNLPLLLMLGEDDPVADGEAGREFYERASSIDKTCLTYPEHRHELLRERGREKVFNDLLAWLRAHAR